MKRHERIIKYIFHFLFSFEKKLELKVFVVVTSGCGSTDCFDQPTINGLFSRQYNMVNIRRTNFLVLSLINLIHQVILIILLFLIVLKKY